MRITISDNEFPELVNLPRGVLRTVINKAIAQYSATDEFSRIILLFDKSYKTKRPQKSIEKHETVVEIEREIKTEPNNKIDISEPDIMGGFLYE